MKQAGHAGTGSVFPPFNFFSKLLVIYDYYYSLGFSG
jgi:hypothetical protein